MTPSPRLALALVCLTMTVTVLGCGKKKRHFVPAPKEDFAEAEPDAAADEAADSDTAVAATAGDADGGASGDGDSDTDDPGQPAGDGDAPEGDLPAALAGELVVFLDKDLPADIGGEKLFTKLVQKCGSVAACAPAECRAVLAKCTGGDVGGCGARLKSSCSAFGAIAQGASGSDLVDKTDVWIRDLWGDLLVKVRLSLPENKQDRVDTLAERHRL